MPAALTERARDQLVEAGFDDAVEFDGKLLGYARALRASASGAELLQKRRSMSESCIKRSDP